MAATASTRDFFGGVGLLVGTKAFLLIEAFWEDLKHLVVVYTVIVVVRGKHMVSKRVTFFQRKIGLLPKRRREMTVSFRKPKIALFEHLWDAVTFSDRVSELLCHESLIVIALSKADVNAETPVSVPLPRDGESWRVPFRETLTVYREYSWIFREVRRVFRARRDRGAS